MPLTRDFRVTIRERLERDPGFREALLGEGVQCLLEVNPFNWLQVRSRGDNLWRRGSARHD